MSAMGSLKGVSCSACRENGHLCQAQMWEEYDEIEGGEESSFRRPLCLRCADGEQCLYESARLRATPQRMTEKVDPFEIPEPTAEDLRFVAEIGKAVSLSADAGKRGARIAAEKRAQVVDDLNVLTVPEIAQKHGISKAMVYNLRTNDSRKVETMKFTSVRREVSGETVHIAPMASMGTEMLEVAEAGNVARVVKAIKRAPTEKRAREPRIARCLICREPIPVKEMRKHRTEAHEAVLRQPLFSGWRAVSVSPKI